MGNEIETGQGKKKKSLEKTPGSSFGVIDRISIFFFLAKEEEVIFRQFGVVENSRYPLAAKTGCYPKIILCGQTFV